MLDLVRSTNIVKHLLERVAVIDAGDVVVDSHFSIKVISVA